MSQNFLFNLPQLKASRDADQEILRKAKESGKTSRTRTVRTGQTGGSKWATKVSIAVDQAKTLLVDDGSIICVRDEKTYFDYIKKIRYARKGSIDTETTGLDPILDHIVGMCLYTPGEKSIYVPSMHTDFDDNVLPNQLSYEAIIEGLREIQDVPLDYHGGIFDFRFMRNGFKLEMPVGWCTQLASNFLNENEKHQLKVLWDKYCNKSDVKSATFGELFKGIPFNYIPIDVAYLYAGKDPKITHELANFQRLYLDPELITCQQKGLADAGKLLRDIEMPLIPIIGRMEDRGIEIDPDKSAELDSKYSKLLEESESVAQAILNELDYSKLSLEDKGKLKHKTNPKYKLNLGSPTQIAVVFYDLMKLKSPDSRNPRGTGEEIIEELLEDYPEHKKLLDGILDFRGIAKLLSTYIIKLPKEVKEITGRLHASFNQYGAKTGRFSSSDPNLQNIPSKNKEIRKMFKAALKKVLISTDFSQQEPRVLAHLCAMLFGDYAMTNAYLAGKDLYSWMASMIYKVDYDDCKEKHPDGSANPAGKKRRDGVKSILLGLMYGRQVKSIAAQLDVAVSEAQKIMDLLFDTFPAIKKVIEYYINMAKEQGCVITVYGRKRRLPEMQLPEFEFMQVDDKTAEFEDLDMCDYYLDRLKKVRYNKDKKALWEEANRKGIWIVDNRYKISEAERQCLNAVIQGTSADITKIAMKAIGEDQQLKDWNCEMLIPIHDEVLSECDEETALKAGNRICELMIQCCADVISVPMSVDAEISRCWYGDEITKELKLKYVS